MNVDRTDVPQISALQVAAQSLHPLADETDRLFVVRYPPGGNEVSLSGLKKLQNALNSRDSPALVHELRDTYIQTTHWMASVDGNLVTDTRYLIHDKYLGRNFDMIKPEDSAPLDPMRVWILGANYAPGNYWHWHAQSLPAIVHAVETIPACDFSRISVLTGPLTDWQRAGLAALGFGPEQITEMTWGKTVHAASILYSDLLSSRQVFARNHARRQTAETLRRVARKSLPHLDRKTGRRLYISRGDTTRRPLLNEAQLSGEMGKLGFTPITNSGMSLLEQIRMYEAADIVVAPHGAGSTNMLYMRPGSAFVEFQQASHVNAGPLSLGKCAGLIPYADVLPDDGLGQATEGWSVDVPRAVALAEMALDRQS